MSDNLTIEEKATNNDTFRHIERVRNLLNACIVELLRRGELHDQSKLTNPEVALFTEFTPKLAGSTYGSPEYEEFRRQMGPALEHHYANNRHHPEFYRSTENWRPVDGYEGCYEVSTFGNVRSVRKSGKILVLNVTPKGYLRIALAREGVQKNFMVHRLVASAFIANDNEKPEVNHKDGDKKNNRVDNLEWVTTSENLIHAYETGLKSPTVKYVVTCDTLDVTTFGCEKMEKELRSRGYKKASASGIWNAANRCGRHLDLEFSATAFEEWMNSPVNDMNLVDLLEMICDWKAASERHNNGNIRKSIEINADRFGMSPQLTKIFENTADLLFESR